MSVPALDNLTRVGQLKAEPRNEAEVTELCATVSELITDVQRLIGPKR